MFYSQFFTCSNPHVDRCSNPRPWDSLNSPQSDVLRAAALKPALRSCGRRTAHRMGTRGLCRRGEQLMAADLRWQAGVADLCTPHVVSFASVQYTKKCSVYTGGPRLVPPEAPNLTSLWGIPCHCPNTFVRRPGWLCHECCGFPTKMPFSSIATC